MVLIFLYFLFNQPTSDGLNKHFQDEIIEVLLSTGRVFRKILKRFANYENLLRILKPPIHGDAPRQISSSLKFQKTQVQLDNFPTITQYNPG